MQILIAGLGGFSAVAGGVLPVIVVHLCNLNGARVLPFPVIAVTAGEGEVRAVPVPGRDLVPPSFLVVPDGPARRA